jgi:type II restriction enzyme
MDIPISSIVFTEGEGSIIPSCPGGAVSSLILAMSPGHSTLAVLSRRADVGVMSYNIHMNTSLDWELALGYKSPAQIAKVLTEGWVESHVYCPSCASPLEKLKANTPVGDFACPKCQEEYELKSKKDIFGSKIVDGAWYEMDNFFLLNYQLRDKSVQNFFVVPKHFLIPGLIEKRKPLATTARRAGWVGCNILLTGIPQAGRIYYIIDGHSEKQEEVLRNWKKTLFLRDQTEPEQRGWTLSVMSCVDKLSKKHFSLDEVYAFENILTQKFPNNKHIKAKIRQQLQILRDNGYLEFVGKGRYRIL